MTADVRQQLTEALDRAERAAKAATAGPWWIEEDGDVWKLHGGEVYQILKAPKRGTDYAEYWPNAADAAHVVRWDPATVLRLVAYFREELQEIDRELADDPADETAQGRLNGVAAFWLGTPEVDR